MYLLNRNGIYYYQRVTMCNGRRQTFRKSLKTRDKARAQLLALQIHFNQSSPDVQQAVCPSHIQEKALAERLMWASLLSLVLKRRVA